MNFKPMLAKDGDPSSLTYPVVVQEKLDGVRASVVNGRLLSRTLKPIPNAELRSALERPEFEGFDGEIIVGDPSAPDAYRRTASFVMAPAKRGEPWVFHAFDLHDRGDADYFARVGRLRVLIERARMSAVQMVPYVVVYSLKELSEFEAGILEQGGEGVIVRIPSMPYKFGRSGKKGPLLKIKRFIDFEAEVVGVYEEMHNGNEAKTNELGRTARSSSQSGKSGKGTLGGLVLRALNGPHAGQEFRCGTGFDAALRASLWVACGAHDRPVAFDGLNGSVAKIKAFPIGCKDKPRHPVFLGWRDMAVDG